VVGSAVRLEPSVLIRGNVGGLVLGSRVHLARGVVLRVEASHGRLRLGDDTTVHQYSLLRTQQGWIDIGHHVSVHPFGIINGEGGVRIGDDVRIGPRVTILSSTHTYGDPDVLVRCQPTQPLPVVIDDDVWVGTGVTVLGGTTIGRGAVIGAGAVVNQDVAPFVVVAGVPARPVGTRGPDDVHPAVSS
jgi:acetyltransferase-like isoleucine patch superfamily enzyme